jgi:rRNA maturation endonuclease Nob1
MGVTTITVTEKLQEQQRFFCENCQHEVFLQAKYCDSCGGKIEWPEKVQKVLASWKKN